MCRGSRAPSSKWRLGPDPGRCSPASAGVAHAFAGRPTRPDRMLGAAARVLHARPWCRLSRMPLVLELASSDPRCTPRRSTSVHHRTKPRTTTAKLIPMGADERRARSRMDEKHLSESTKPSTSDDDGPWHQHQNVTRRAALVPKRDCQSRSSKVPCFIERLADLLTPWKSGGRRGSR